MDCRQYLFQFDSLCVRIDLGESGFHRGMDMNERYAYSAYLLPSFITVLLLIALSIYSGYRRNVPGALPFMIGCLFAALWAAGSVMEYAAVDVAAKILWAKFQSAWQLPLVTAILCFGLEYAWHSRWLTRRNLILLSIPSILVLGLILTNDLHHLTWQRFEFDGSIMPRLGSVGWIAFSYAYAVILANFLILAWLFIRSPYHRWPVILMLIGQFGGRTIFLLERFQILHAILPIEVVGMGFEFLMYVVALFGFRIFDPIPMARQTVITQMRDGMLALDAQGQVVSLNPAAERILRRTSKQIMGKNASELFPAYLGGNFSDFSGAEIELRWETEQELRHYALTISPLKDWHELEIGRLLLLHDVTAQRRAQAQLLEQQQVVATLQERERLARELHDSLGQTLAAVHIQSVTARMFLAQGENASTDGCLEQLAEMSLMAEVDVREYLLGARSGFQSDHSFFVILREYAARFSDQYGLLVEISVPAQLEARGLGAAVEVQLLRIIQEALSNVRKHARAKNVQVMFTEVDSRAEIAIMDDGQGFDVAAVMRETERFGLQSMRERVESLGGSFEIHSQPGLGTQVIIHAPIQNGEIIR